MAININGPTQNQVGANKTQKNNGSNEATDLKSGNGTKTASKDDVVEVSDRARVLKAVESRVSQMPDIDQDKVDRIRNAISNGEYKIDYDKLAAAFRRFENGL
jgi:negative regulator of flagellin synthesis FlgM